MRIALAAAILAYIFSRIPIGDVFAALASVDPLIYCIGMFFTIILRFCEAGSFKVLTNLHDMKITYWFIFLTSISATFYSLFLPGDIGGGIVKWHRFSKENKKRAEAFSIVVFNRFVRYLCIILVGLLFAIIDPDLATHETIRPTLYVLSGGFLALFLLLINKKSALFVMNILGIWNERAMPQFLKVKVGKILGAFLHFRMLTYRQLSWLIVFTITAHLAGVFVMFVFARSIAIDLPIVKWGWIRSVISLITLLPISFSGIGIREGGLLVLLQPLGIAPSFCIAFSLVLFSRILFIGLIGGFLELVSFLRKSRIAA